MSDRLDEVAQAVEVYQRRTSAGAITVSSSGSNDVLTPASGKYILLQYICLSADAANAAEVTVSVLLGAALKYKVSLKPGAIWARNVGAGRRVVTGNVDEKLTVTLSAAQTVHVSSETEQY